MTDSAASTSERVATSAGRWRLNRLARGFPWVPAAILLAVFVAAIAGEAIAPHDPNGLNLAAAFRPPVWSAAGSGEYLLGTDNLGRDILSRIMYGARVSLVVGIVPLIIILIIGVPVGMFAGLKGGRTDNLLMRFADILYAFPDLLFFIIVMTALRASFIGQLLNGLFLLFTALALVGWVGVSRLVRGQTLSLKEKEFVEAARMVGSKNGRIMRKHLLPNTLGPIIVVSAFLIPGFIITEAVLGYLGVGLRPSTNPDDIFITSWGAMLLDGQTAINAQPWLLLAPAICVALIVLSFNFLGDGLRDALDPRLRDR